MRLAGYLNKMSMARRRACLQHCALHLDTDDGERLHGSPLLYALLCEIERYEGVDPPHPLPASDLVVFEHGRGGRCVRVQTACLHHVCIVIMRSDLRLHCNVRSPGRQPHPFEHATRSAGHSLRLTSDLVLCVYVCARTCFIPMATQVFPNSLEVETPPGLALLRLVPYARAGIDTFADAIKRQPELWEEAKRHLDARLGKRARRSEFMVQGIPN